MGMDNKARAAANLAARTSTYMTKAEKALALFDAAPEPEDVPWNEISKKKGKQSKQVHVPVASNQDPAHAHMHLGTKRAYQREKEHQLHHEIRKLEHEQRQSNSAP